MVVIDSVSHESRTKMRDYKILQSDFLWFVKKCFCYTMQSNCVECDDLDLAASMVGSIDKS